MAAPSPVSNQPRRSPTPPVDLVGDPLADASPDASPRPQVARPSGSEAWQFNQPVLLRRSPRASSLMVWTLVGGSALLMVWALVAPLAETVAVQGKLQPGSRVKQVEAPVAGVVAEIAVKEGEPVRQGQLLVRFDLREARSRLLAAEAVRARLASENRIYASALGDRAASSLTVNQRLQLQSQRADLQGRLRAAQQELRQSQQRLAGLRQSWATSNDIANRFEALASTGAVSGVQALQTRDTANQLQSRLLEELRVEARLQATLIQAQAGPAADLRGRIEANLRQMSELEGQIRQARLQIQFGQLTAPSDGVVFDLLVNPGSVVPTSGVLMTVVPGDSLDARVLVPSRVIGFVLPGQKANISIDTFPSTDYGRVPAVVRSIGSDALTPEEMRSSLGAEANGLFYPVTLQLQNQHLQARTRVVPLKAGMTLTADIRLRERPFISVLTSFFEDKLRSLERLR
jgi:HlyD family secretion protein